jgi:phosphatidylethanolamine-binding protein (PEBP) family uncharacterized protein
MNKIFLTLLLLITTTEYLYAQTLNVDFKWMLKHKCSKSSPELKVENIPKGTVELKINMIDHQRPNLNSFHGGGNLKKEAGFPSSFTIAEGALQTYNGPCPPDVESYYGHDYEFFVVAVDKQNNEVGKSSKKKTWGTKDVKE